MEFITIFSELADNKNKHEKIIYFISQLLLEIVFSFWIANLLGFKYDEQKITLENMIKFFSTYQILIPLISYLFVFLLLKLIYPILLYLVQYLLFRDELSTTEGFRRLLKFYGILNITDENYEIIKNAIDKLISEKGVTNLLNQCTLLLSLCVVTFPLCLIYSKWFFVLYFFLFVLTILASIGFMGIRTIYLRKNEMNKLIEEEYELITKQ